MAPTPADHEDARSRPHGGSTSGTPRWVKVFAIVVAVLAVLVVVVLLPGGGPQGPGRHTSSRAGAGEAPPASVVHVQQVAVEDRHGELEVRRG